MIQNKAMVSPIIRYTSLFGGSGAGSLCRQSFPDMPPLPTQQNSMLPGELNLNQKMGFGNGSINSLPGGFADFAGFANLPDPATFRAQLTPTDAASLASSESNDERRINTEPKMMYRRRRKDVNSLVPAEVGSPLETIGESISSISRPTGLNMTNLQIPGGLGNPFNAFFSNEPLGMAFIYSQSQW